MNPRLLELALKKQRLQMQAATQRLQIARHLQVFAPALVAADAVGAAGRWLRAHPQWLAGAAAALLVVRPRAVFRWARRGFLAWRMLRKAREALLAAIPARH